MYRYCLLELGHILICTCKVTQISDSCKSSAKNHDILYKNYLQKYLQNGWVPQNAYISKL